MGMAATAFRPHAGAPRGARNLGRTAVADVARPVADLVPTALCEPVLWGEEFGRAMTVSDPAGIKHVLLDNAQVYEKGRVQRRVLGPMLAQGMLLTEGETWKRARRTVAPLFAPRRLAGATARMHEIAEAGIGAWLEAGTGRLLDMDQEMVTSHLEMLSATSRRWQPQAEGFERAVLRYTETAARADPLDVMGAPTGFRAPAGSWAARRPVDKTSVSELVADHRERLGVGDAPDDLMTALLKAQDPETSASPTSKSRPTS